MISKGQGTLPLGWRTAEAGLRVTRGLYPSLAGDGGTGRRGERLGGAESAVAPALRGS